MTEQRALSLRKSLIAGCALVAAIVFVSFCSVVHGAVDRAARQRLAAADALVQRAEPALKSATPALQRAAAPGSALLARVGN